MSNIFELAFDELMKLEGGFSDDADDPGGRTNYGISQKQYPSLDIAALTKDEAREIYRRDYWNPIRLDEVSNDFVAAEALEQSVHMGPTQAIKNIQTALNYLGEGLTVDGVMGPNTLHAVNEWSAKDHVAFLKVLNGVQFTLYLGMVEKNPKLKKYARGWTRRLEV